MCRAAAIFVAVLALGCGPGASPEKPTSAAAVVAPYEVTLVAGTDPARLDDVAASGATVVREPHLEGDAYLVRMTAAVAERVRAVAGVAAVAPLAPTRRYSEARFAGATGPVAVVVDVFEGADPGAVVAAIRGWGGEPVESAPHTVRARLDPARIGELAAMPEVRWIEPR